jgi:hypothetical protein
MSDRSSSNQLSELELERRLAIEEREADAFRAAAASGIDRTAPDVRASAEDTNLDLNDPAYGERVLALDGLEDPVLLAHMAKERARFSAAPVQTVAAAIDFAECKAALTDLASVLTRIADVSARPRIDDAGLHYGAESNFMSAEASVRRAVQRYTVSRRHADAFLEGHARCAELRPRLSAGMLALEECRRQVDMASALAGRPSTAKDCDAHRAEAVKLVVSVLSTIENVEAL